MKKVLLLLLTIVTVTTMSACEDTKYNDAGISVIFFTANSGATLVETQFELEAGQLLEAPEDPTRLGFIFDGWYTDFQKTDEWDFDVDHVGDKSTILYAKWIPALFNINYDLNGGEFATTTYLQTFLSGESKVLPQPSRAGYSFVAWYLYDWIDSSSTKPGDAGYQTIPANTFEDLNLYAHWDAITVRITFRANYPVEDEGPSNPSAVTVAYGTVIDFEMLDATSQYTFVGWNSKSDGTGTNYTNGEIFERTQRITLYGIWELIE